ncbi:MAG: TonB family protein [Saprospiraceae bacterium]|nr:TonB family protein [Saprospiraceae bacterium]
MEKLLLQISGCLILFYGIYHLSLRKLTFFEVNRWYLLTSIILSILIPTVGPLIEVNKPEIFVYNMETVTIATPIVMDQSRSFEDWAWLIAKFVYLTGVFIALTRLSVGLYKIWRLYVGGKKLWKGNLHFVYNDAKHLPFSFLGSIYISNNVQLNDRVKEVILHEEVHVRRGHTFDILFTELAHAIFWFNPIFIFYKRALKASHEFIADNVVSSASDKYAYIQTLVGTAVSGIQLELTNQFFHSQIKKRLEMMNTHTSRKSSLGRYFLAIPLIFALAIGFASAKNYIYPDGNLDAISAIDTLPANAKYFINGKPVSAAQAEKIPTEAITAMDVKKAADTKEVSEIRFTTKDFYVIPDKPANDDIKEPKAGELIPNSLHTAVFKVVEEMPRFPGCEDMEGDKLTKESCARQKLLEFIYRNVKYPATARTSRTQGTAVVQFVVNENGMLEDINILRDPGSELGAAAKAVVELMNTNGIKWIPGKQRGDLVKVQYVLPIKFKLDDEAASENKSIEETKSDEQPTSIRIRGTDAMGKTPLFVVDGNIVEMKSLEEINPEKIESINILKDESATRLYGSKGENGVVVIKLKDGKNINTKGEKLDEVVVVGYGKPHSNTEEKEVTGVKIRATGTGNGQAQPVIIVDGKKIPNAELELLDPECIKSMVVLKGEKATEKYGNDAKDGAIEITTKDGKVLKVQGKKRVEGTVKQSNSNGEIEVKGYSTKSDKNDNNIVLSSGIAVSAFPNPVEEKVQLEIEAKEAGDVTVELFTAEGKLLKKQTVSANKGKNNVSMDLPASYQAQFALVRVTQGKFVATQKLIIK